MSYSIGQIIAWDNSSLIPEHWSICDGTNGTPDMRNRFVVGGNPLLPSAIRTSGGDSTHTHSYATNTGLSPAHNHTRGSSTTSSGGNDDSVYGGTGSTASNASHTHSIAFTVNDNTTFHSHVIATSGSASSLPAYITLLFIMKYE